MQYIVLSIWSIAIYCIAYSWSDNAITILLYAARASSVPKLHCCNTNSNTKERLNQGQQCRSHLEYCYSIKRSKVAKRALIHLQRQICQEYFLHWKQMWHFCAFPTHFEGTLAPFWQQAGIAINYMLQNITCVHLLIVLDSGRIQAQCVLYQIFQVGFVQDWFIISLQL